MPRSGPSPRRVVSCAPAVAGALLAGAFVLSNCSSGDDSTVVVSPLEWARFRRDTANSGLGSGQLAENTGEVRPVIDLRTLPDPPEVTSSTPVIGADDVIYLGTSKGLLAVTKQGEMQWFFDKEDVRACDPGGDGRKISISGSPALIINTGTAATVIQKQLVVGSDDGRIFALQDNGADVQCLWVYSPPTPAPTPTSTPTSTPGEATSTPGEATSTPGEAMSTPTPTPSEEATPTPTPTPRCPAPPLSSKAIVSSPILITDLLDGSLTSVYIGTGDGYLLALNGNGTEQWRFPAGGPLTASPIVFGSLLYFTASDGFLHSVDTAGLNPDQTTRPIALPASPLQASPALTVVAVHTVQPVGDNGERSQVSFATTNLDFINFQYETDATVLGSPAATSQTFQIVVPPTQVVSPEPTPEATATPFVQNTTETIVIVVDRDGTVYGLRDTTGDLFVTFNPDDVPQTVNSESVDSKLRVDTGMGRVHTSPAISAEGFVVFGDDTGYVYAVQLGFDRSPPCEDCVDTKWTPALARPGMATPTPAMAGGQVKVSESAICSSPIIDFEGTIYVTTDDGILWAIGVPPA